MDTKNTVDADMKAVVEHITTGKPLDPAVDKRIGEQAKQAREKILRVHGIQDIAVQLIREARGPLDPEQERELTLAQRDRLRQGELRLIDPDTGKTYVLIPEEEYERLHQSTE